MAICFPSNCGGCTRRRAFTVLEIAIAAGLLGLLMTASVQVLRAMQTQQRAADRRASALHTVQALAEQISSFSWKDVTSERLRQLELPPPITEYLPEAQMTASLMEESEPVPAKRVTVELTWRGPKGQPAAPLRMTIWVFAN
jgi:type II secretory pathway pseudopilin PulG